MFDLSPKNVLSGPDTMDLVETLLKNAHESEKPTTKHAFCNHAETYLRSMKKFVRRPSPSTNSSSGIAKTDSNDDDKVLQQRIARAYRDHANLVADQNPKLALDSQRRADLWGPGATKNIALQVKKAAPVTIVATVSANIFPVDYRPFSTAWLFPGPDERVEDTPQLVSCLGLLKQASVDLPEDALDTVARKWLRATAQNSDEKTRLETLATDVVRAFTKDEIKDDKAIAEVLCLAPVLNSSDFRFLLDLLVNSLKENTHTLLDFGALRGVAQMLRSATPDHQLSSQDLIDILVPISKKLQDTHEGSPKQIFELTVAVSSVLDAMADARVTGLKRVVLHEPLLAFLGSLRKNDDPHLEFYASYAFQALLCIPNDESSWQATVRRTTAIVKGVSGLVSAVKSLDLTAFMTGLQTIQQGFEGAQQVWELGKSAIEGIKDVFESEQDVVDSLKETFTLNRRRAWYSALRGADTLLNGGELTQFKILVCGATCRLDVEFQWGICQRLGAVAANPRWGIEVRQGAVRFLEEIYRNDSVWELHKPIKALILDILKRLSVGSTKLPDAVLLLDNLAADEEPVKQSIYRSCVATAPSQHSLLPGPLELASPSLISRVQKRMNVERELRQLHRNRVKERDGSVYITPMAKSSLQPSDKNLFSLSLAVDKFLKSEDQKVLLLLGDSGVGKTTFNRELDLKLWEAYMKEPKTNRIPLLISLPAIDRPEKDLIVKHLRLCEFTDSQIAELKVREFVIICDGYDESQQTHNLYKSNGFNEGSGWKAQMVISCRSDHLGQDYRDTFQPARRNPTDPDPFLQAVLVPFSTDQVEKYITEYVTIKKPLWEALDYIGILKQIPSLQELVKNPFLLTLTLEVLPRLADPGQKLTTSKITRVQLYDEFVTQWLERNKKRLGTQELSDQEKEAFESLSEDGFALQGLTFLRDLAAAIYNEQGGSPVVDYSKTQDIETWKERFFGRKDHEVRLLRKALPLTRNGSRFGFIHRSILEYGVSRAIYAPSKQSSIKIETVEADTGRKSMDSILSFEREGELRAKVPEQRIQGPNPDSPLVKKSFVKITSVIQFLAERAEQEQPFKDELFAYVEASKSESKWRLAAANAITILVRAGIPFNGKDLTSVQIAGADLSYGLFDSAQLQGADLRKVILRNSWLRQANLSGARMLGVEFGEWPYLQQDCMISSSAYSPDYKTYAVGLENGTINVYDTSTWEKPLVLQGHTDWVTSVMFSPSGDRIVSGSKDKTIRLWEKQTGAAGPILCDHTDCITGVAYSPDGLQIASASYDKTVRLWDAATGAAGPILSDHTDWVTSVVYSPDGCQIASGSKDKTIRLWEAKTGAAGPVLSGHTSEISSVVYSPSGNQIASGSFDNSVRLWDTQNSTESHVLSLHTKSVTCVVYSPSGHQVASGSRDKTVRLWDAKTGAAGPVLNGHTNWVISLAYSPSGHQIVSASYDKTLRLWEVQTGSDGPVLSGHTERVKSVVYSPSGHQIVSIGWDKTLRMWETKAGATGVGPGPVLVGHTKRVKDVAFSPSGHQVVSGSDDNTVRLWEAQTGSVGHILSGHTSRITCLAYSSSGHQIASGSNDVTVRLWDAETGAAGPVLSDHSDWVTCLAYSPSGHQIASGSYDKTVRLWDTRTGAAGPVLLGHTARVRSVAYSPTDRQVASGSWDTTVRLWDPDTGVAGIVLNGHTDAVWRVVYSPGGDQIASASYDKTVRLWEAKTGKEIHVLKGHTGWVTSVVYSPCGSQIATGCDNNTVRLWEVSSGHCSVVINEHINGRTHGVTSVVYSPSGAQIAFGSDDGTVRICEVRSGRNLSVVSGFQGPISSIAWSETLDGVFFITGCHDGSVRMWRFIEEADDFQVRLHWSTKQDSLVLSNATIQKVKGLSRISTQLLKQRGAMGDPEPLMTIQDAGSTVKTMQSAVSKFKQQRTNKTNTTFFAAVAI